MHIQRLKLIAELGVHFVRDRFSSFDCQDQIEELEARIADEVQKRQSALKEAVKQKASLLKSHIISI